MNKMEINEIHTKMFSELMQLKAQIKEGLSIEEVLKKLEELVPFDLDKCYYLNGGKCSGDGVVDTLHADYFHIREVREITEEELNSEED